MQLILKDGYIHLVQNEFLENNKVEGQVIVKYVDDFEKAKFSYSINGSPFKPILKERIIFNLFQFKDVKALRLEIKAEKPNGIEIFKSDELPLTYKVLLGKANVDLYPKTMQHLFDEIERLKQRVTELEEVGELI